jgi:hypothetical protein
MMAAGRVKGETSMNRQMTPHIEYELVPIEDHPYFKARTKRGKPFKRRQALLVKHMEMGLMDYYRVKPGQLQEIIDAVYGKGVKGELCNG